MIDLNYCNFSPTHMFQAEQDSPQSPLIDKIDTVANPIMDLSFSTPFENPSLSSFSPDIIDENNDFLLEPNIVKEPDILSFASHSISSQINQETQKNPSDHHAPLIEHIHSTSIKKPTLASDFHQEHLRHAESTTKILLTILSDPHNIGSSLNGYTNKIRDKLPTMKKSQVKSFIHTKHLTPPAKIKRKLISDYLIQTQPDSRVSHRSILNAIKQAHPNFQSSQILISKMRKQLGFPCLERHVRITKARQKKFTDAEEKKIKAVALNHLSLPRAQLAQLATDQIGRKVSESYMRSIKKTLLT